MKRERALVEQEKFEKEKRDRPPGSKPPPRPSSGSSSGRTKERQYQADPDKYGEPIEVLSRHAVLLIEEIALLQSTETSNLRKRLT